ncbi:MAG: hypothetical protein HKN87_00560 [Saprospiraceae bacterium]|nr:hypothetical protein [Saprospiraceae bacterium]
MSEKTLDNLINRLKTEAIEKAEQEAGKVVDDARREADTLIRDAEAQKGKILDEARIEAEAIVRKGVRALQQASRDVCISVQNDLLTILGHVLSEEINRTFTTELIRSTVVQVVENVGRPSKINLPTSVMEELGDFIRQRLQQTDEMLTVSRDERLLKGFTIARTDLGWKYEISPEEVSDLLFAHLTPTWTNVLKKDVSS